MAQDKDQVYDVVKKDIEALEKAEFISKSGAADIRKTLEQMAKDKSETKEEAEKALIETIERRIKYATHDAAFAASKAQEYANKFKEFKTVEFAEIKNERRADAQFLSDGLIKPIREFLHDRAQLTIAQSYGLLGNSIDKIREQFMLTKLNRTIAKKDRELERFNNLYQRKVMARITFEQIKTLAIATVKGKGIDMAKMNDLRATAEKVVQDSDLRLAGKMQHIKELSTKIEEQKKGLIDLKRNRLDLQLKVHKANSLEEKQKEGVFQRVNRDYQEAKMKVVINNYAYKHMYNTKYQVFKNEYFSKNEYNADQLQEIATAIKNNVSKENLDIIANPELSAKQMMFLRTAAELDIKDIDMDSLLKEIQRDDISPEAIDKVIVEKMNESIEKNPLSEEIQINEESIEKKEADLARVFNDLELAEQRREQERQEQEQNRQENEPEKTGEVQEIDANEPEMEDIDIGDDAR